jgi:hypothetical protein
MMVDNKFVARYLRSRCYPRASEHRNRAREALIQFPEFSRSSENRRSFLDRMMGNRWLSGENRWKGSSLGLAWHLRSRE